MSLEDQIFKRHYNYYKSIGVETIKQQAGQVEQVSSDYQGRVIFELLQNAFDKAKKNILVEVVGNSLYIANDGAKFTYNTQHDYSGNDTKQADIFKRYDFQSLCSISTSSKISAESIGNKGVGFKSVFSIAKNGFVNVYTEGIMYQEEKQIPETISFGIYDSYKDEASVPSGFNKVVRKSIVEKINLVQRERKERGVPGYYFPLHITKEPENIINYFEKGFVTIIEIPFDDIEKIKPLFEEIHKIHFNFISLKYSNIFEIQFEINSESYKKHIDVNTNRFFSAPMRNEIIESLAKEAGVKIGQENKVAIYFKTKEEIKDGLVGLIYNYLPTKQESPFKYVDFHADFHTSVDRKSIEFDQNSKIGRYNASLLKACVELYFSVLNARLIESDRVELSIQSIVFDKHVLFQEFRWEYLILNRSDDIYHFVRAILQINDVSINQWNCHDGSHYASASLLFSNLAKQLFKKEDISDEIRSEFFKNTIAFIHRFTNDYKMQYSRSEIFKEEFAKQLLEKEPRILPDCHFSRNIEILYKDEGKNNVELPDFLGINITNFNIPDAVFQEKLGIKKYTDINVLFKYFRQVSIKGKVSDERTLSEEEQVTLLKSLFQLFKTKKEQIESFAHRYRSFLTENDRKNYSPQNITNFSVSTVFLKTNFKKFKPAQLCNKEELNKDFLGNVIDDGDYMESFLNFLGVSSEQNYLVVDNSIYINQKDGLDYIPMLYSRDETGNLTAKEIIPNISIITPKKSVHPSLVNYNRYSFLDDISNTKVRQELRPLRIGDYDLFPDEYANILFDRINDNTTKYPLDVFRLYSANAFHLFDEKKLYFIVNNGKYSWVENTNFKIAQNRSDFELLKSQPIDLLCYFNAKEVPSHLQNNIIDLETKGVKLSNQKNITTEFKASFEKLIPYILAEISYLNISISEKDYIKNLGEVTEFQKKWNHLNVESGENLSVIIEYQEDKQSLKLQQNYCVYNNTLYFDNAITNNHKATAIAKHIFNIGSLNSKIELLFFHKKIEDIVKEYNQVDIELITHKWLPNYDEKFQSFQKNILTHFGFNLSENKLWYLYNEQNKSKVLIHLEKEGRLNELIQIVNNNKLKAEYIDYFENFNVKIDRTHIERKVSKLLVILQQNNSSLDLLHELELLSSKLNCENRLREIEEEICDLYPNSLENGLSQESGEKQKELDLNNKVSSIFDKLHYLDNKVIKNIDLGGSYSTKQIPVNSKKIIYKGKELPDSKNLESMGASGEEEVLLFFIREFIEIKGINQRKKAITDVYKLLKTKIGDDSHQKYRDACFKVLHDDLKLQKALIPLFYVTMHHKFSYFDLIAYHENQPTLIEVKTTNKSKRFYLSIAEVEISRGNDNYLIIQNSKESINLIGNPIKDIEKDITFIEGDYFSLKPRNYEFVLKAKN